MQHCNKIIYLVLVLLFSFKVHASADCYEVRLEDKNIICLTQGVGSLSAVDRVSLINEKIKKIAEDYSYNPEQIRVTEAEGAFLVKAGELSVLALSAKDIDTSTDELEQVAQNVSHQIKSAVAEYRLQRSPAQILSGALYTLAATCVLLIAFVLLGKILSFLNGKTKAISEKYIDILKTKPYRFISSYRIHQIVYGLFTSIKVMVVLTLLYFYVPLVLSFFPWTSQFAPKIINYALEPVLNIVHVVFNYLPKIFNIFIIIGATHFFLKFLRLIFDEIQIGNIKISGFHQEWAQPTFTLVKILFYAVAVIMVFPYLPGSGSPAFQGVSVFLGALISFGSGSSIANIIAGIVITYMRPFKIGDRVKIADTIGDVVEKNFLVTRVKTIKNVDITIPNSMVLGSHIINYSSSAEEQGLILNTTVTIGYDTAWKTVHSLLKEAARKTELVDQTKEPFVYQTALNDFYVSYEINAYTQQAGKMASIYSELHKNIQDVFNEAGVEIMSPHYSSLRDGNEVTIPASFRQNKMDSSS